METAERPSTRRVHRRVILRRRRGRRAGGPAPAGGQARTSSTTITATTPLPQGPVRRVHRPPLRSLRPPRLRPPRRPAASPRTFRTRRGEASASVRCGSSASSDRGLRDRSLHVAGVRGRPGTAAHSLRSPGYGRDPPPGMIRDWGTDRGRLVGAQVRGCQSARNRDPGSACNRAPL